MHNSILYNYQKSFINMINPGLEKREMNVKIEERERKRFPFSKQEDKQLLRLVN